MNINLTDVGIERAGTESTIAAMENDRSTESSNILLLGSNLFLII